MKTMRVLTLALVLSLLALGLVRANGGVERPRQVLGGGATSTTVGSITLRATVGQPFVGSDTNDGVTLGHGFWHGGVEGVDFAVYLPLVLGSWE